MFTPTRLPGTPTTIVGHVDGEAERGASGPAGLQVVEQLVGDVQVAKTRFGSAHGVGPVLLQHRGGPPARRFVIAVQRVRADVYAVRPGDRAGDWVHHHLRKEGRLPERLEHAASVQ